jgi:lysophospholipase L1-like esterase
MTARGRLMARLVTILIAFAGFVMAGTLPAAAQSNSGPVQYVALGDSYAAGQGGGDYINDCLESPNGYPYLLDHRRRIDLRDNVACTGATTFEVISEQLPALTEDTELVTLTVGAADLGLSTVLTACTAGTQEECLTAVAIARTKLGMLAVNLANLYAAVADEAPNALIVVTGYPYLFEPPAEGDPNAAIITAINNAITALNSTIQQAVLAAQTASINIIYVDVTDEFAGHGIGSTHPFINATGPDAYHPNAAGYIAYAEAISAALPSAWLDEKQAA